MMNEQTQDDQFSEEAIEAAYQQALMASEEAGIIPPPMTVEQWENAETADEINLSESETPPASESTPQKNESTRPRLKPAQIIEALLFVGGEPLSAKKIASFLGDHCRAESIREDIDEINARYQRQSRPYEIVLGSEGYKIVLRSEFHTQRSLLFGAGPKEVRLTPEVLEVLSLVAYQQPITKSELEEVDRSNVMTGVRQLIRRELIESTKREDGEIEYRTTDRFLSIFGISTLEELPRTRNLQMK